MERAKYKRDISFRRSSQEEICPSKIIDKQIKQILDRQDVKKIIGFSRFKFGEILKQIRPILVDIDSRGQIYSANVSSQSTYSDRTHLFVTLQWLRQYPILASLALQTSIPTSSVTLMLRRTLVALDQLYEEELAWPSDQYLTSHAQRFVNILGNRFANLVAVVDGTEIRINRPSDPHLQRAVYSVKKKQHSISILLICILDGILLYVSDPLIGANDQQHWNELELLVIGFTFNHRVGQKHGNEIPILGYTPYKKPKGGKLSKEQKEFNRHLSSLRVVVENVIAQIKKWRILKGSFRHFSLLHGNQIEFSLVVRVVTKLVARSLRQRPLRHSNWIPPRDSSSKSSSESDTDTLEEENSC
jgi:hypothetical protein